METIGNVLISYDIDKLHTQVKTEMKSLGYYDYFTLNNSTYIYDLPNTALWHQTKSSRDAINDLKRICNNLGAKLEKAVAVRASEFEGI